MAVYMVSAMGVAIIHNILNSVCRSHSTYELLMRGVCVYLFNLSAQHIYHFAAHTNTHKLSDVCNVYAQWIRGRWVGGWWCGRGEAKRNISSEIYDLSGLSCHNICHLYTKFSFPHVTINMFPYFIRGDCILFSV